MTTLKEYLGIDTSCLDNPPNTTVKDFINKLKNVKFGDFKDKTSSFSIDSTPVRDYLALIISTDSAKIDENSTIPDIVLQTIQAGNAPPPRCQISCSCCIFTDTTATCFNDCAGILSNHKVNSEVTSSQRIDRR